MLYTSQLIDLLLLAQTSFVSWFLTHGLRMIIIVIGALLARGFLHKFIERIIRRIVPANKFAGSALAERKRENTLIRIIQGTAQVLIILITTLLLLSEVGINIGPLIAAAGVVGLALGFGGQYLIRDLISGFFIILENQYRIGDVVCFDTTCGSVEDITLRATILRDLDGTVHHVPHGSINRVSNRSKQFARVNINLGVGYSSDLEQVIAVINETGNVLGIDEAWKDRILKPIQFERVQDFADSAIMVKVLGETLPLEQWAVAGEFRKRIKVAFDKAGINLPFPQRVIHTAKK